MTLSWWRPRHVADAAPGAGVAVLDGRNPVMLPASAASPAVTAAPGDRLRPVECPQAAEALTLRRAGNCGQARQLISTAWRDWCARPASQYGPRLLVVRAAVLAGCGDSRRAWEQLCLHADLLAGLDRPACLQAAAWIADTETTHPVLCRQPTIRGVPGRDDRSAPFWPVLLGRLAAPQPASSVSQARTSHTLPRTDSVPATDRHAPGRHRPRHPETR